MAKELNRIWKQVIGMYVLKGYIVRMWTSDGAIHTEKRFMGADLSTRREAFAFADNLVDIMEEARQAGVLRYNNPEEILDPSVNIEDVVIGSVHVSILYESMKEDLVVTQEDLIYMPVANEGSSIEVPVDGNKTLRLLNLEKVDLTDDETIRIFNKEAEHYLQNGGHEGIMMLHADDQVVYLLMDDYRRLVKKGLIVLEKDEEVRRENAI